MGCIRVDKIVEYLCEPLRKCLKDEDPYVRKTAAVCVAKLYDINGELVEDQGFLEMVYDLLGDSNPMVVSNAVATLAEISETSTMGRQVFQINTSTLQKMLAALNECTEWGQVCCGGVRLALGGVGLEGGGRAGGGAHAVVCARAYLGMPSLTVCTAAPAFAPAALPNLDTNRDPDPEPEGRPRSHP